MAEEFFVEGPMGGVRADVNVYEGGGEEFIEGFLAGGFWRWGGRFRHWVGIRGIFEMSVRKLSQTRACEWKTERQSVDREDGETQMSMEPLRTVIKKEAGAAE